MAATFQDSKYDIRASRYHCAGCQGEIACEAQYYSVIFFASEQFERRDYCEACWAARSSHGGGDNSDAPQGSGTLEGSGTPESSGEPGAPTLPYAFWKTKRPPLTTEKPKRLHFDVEVVLQFFRALSRDAAEETSQAHGAEAAAADAVAAEAGAAEGGQSGEDSQAGEEREELAFVLGLLLIRKKALTLVSTAERDGGEWLKVVERKEPESSFWIKNPDLNSAQLERVKVRIGELLQMQI